MKADVKSLLFKSNCDADSVLTFFKPSGLVLLSLMLFLMASHSYAQTVGDYRSNAATFNWSTTASWQRWNGAAWIANPAQGYPGQNAVSGTVTIRNGHTVTLNVTPANNIGSLVVGEGTTGTMNVSGNTSFTTTGNLTINPGGTFAFSGTGNLTIGGTSQIDGTFSESDNTGVDTFTGLVTISLTGVWNTVLCTAEDLMQFDGGVTNSGTFNAGGIQLANNTIVTANANMSISNGLDTEQNGSVTIAGPGVVTLSGDQSNISVNLPGSTTGTLTINGTVNITSAGSGGGIALAVLGDLIVNGTLTHASAVTGHINIGGDFIVNGPAGSVTSTTATGNFTVSGTTTISGSFTDSQAANINTFTGLVTIDAGGSFTTTAVTTTTNLLFRGGITHNGTTFSAGAATFSTNNQTISGTSTLNFANTVTVTAGETLTNNGTITMSNTATGSLTGAAGSVFTQGVNSTLNYAGQTMTIPTLNASNAGNTVNYNRAGIQTIFNPSGSNYRNLTISTSGTKSIGNNTNILGNLTVQGSSTFNLNGSDIALTGDMSVINTAVLDADAVGSDITIAGDWSITSTAGDPFLQGTRTVTFNGTSNQTISGTALGTTFNNLTVNNTSASPAVTLNNNVIVGATLNMNDGNINLNTRNLQLGTSAAAVGTLTYNIVNGSWMYGGTHTRFYAAGTNFTPDPLGGDFRGIFVVGRDTDIRPMAVYPPATAPTTGGSITVGYNASDVTTALSPTVNDAGTPIVLRHESSWPVSTATLVGGTWNMYAGGTGFTIGDINDIRLMLSNSVVGNAGTNDATFLPIAARTNLTLANLTNTFYLGSINAVQTPLPIELLYFRAHIENDFVKTEWSTAQETDNHFFTVEKTVDFETFYEVGILESKGSSQEKRTYSFIDQSPIGGKSYYRLKQTDFDGKFTYSEPVMINYEGTSNASLQTYPNPSNGYNITVELKGLREKTDVPLVIYDQRGQKVYETIISKEDRATVTKDINFDSALPQGVYVIKAGKTLELTRKIVID